MAGLYCRACSELRQERSGRAPVTPQSAPLHPDFAPPHFFTCSTAPPPYRGGGGAVKCYTQTGVAPLTVEQVEQPCLRRSDEIPRTAIFVIFLVNLHVPFLDPSFDHFHDAGLLGFVG
jgi:hypothetical protein